MTNFTIKGSRREIAFLAGFALLLSFGFLVFFSSTTSFLNPWYGRDSAIFRLIGTAMAEGKSVYADIWDHKGPALFATQWLGQIIWPGRGGIFLIQVVSLAIALVFLGLIARRALPPLLVVITMVLFLAILAPLFEHGNLTEELSLPYTMFVLWALTRSFRSNHETVPLLLLALSGGAMAWLFFMRLNNAAGIIAAFVAYFIFVLWTRQRFWLRFGVAVAGFALVTGAILIHFALAGSLAEMLHATFIFNFEYASEDSGSYSKMLGNGYYFVAIALIAGTLFGGLVEFQGSGRPWYFVLTIALAVVGGLAVLSSTTAFLHYLQILVPGAGLGLVFLLSVFTAERQKFAALIAVLISVALIIPFAIGTAKRSAAENQGQYSEQVGLILENVPESERDEIFTWNIRANYYLSAETLPVHRFFMLQDWWGRSDPIVYEELRQFFRDTPPAWVITPAEGISNPEFRAIVEENYQLVKTSEDFRLYKRSS